VAGQPFPMAAGQIWVLLVKQGTKTDEVHPKA
jgi:hypothetical protein